MKQAFDKIEVQTPLEKYQVHAVKKLDSLWSNPSGETLLGFVLFSFSRNASTPPAPPSPQEQRIELRGGALPAHLHEKIHI